MYLFGLIFSTFIKMRTQCGHGHNVFQNIYHTFVIVNLQLWHKPIFYIGKTVNSAGESEISLRLYVFRDIRIRMGSGIWIDRKRWGKKNDINISLIQGDEREMLLEKRTKLKA